MVIDARKWTLDLLKTPSERDKQWKIGPSSIGDPCTYCIAEQLIASQGQGEETKGSSLTQYWMGARFGTAIHETLEKAAIAQGFDWIVPERKITIGDLEGYGTITGSADVTVIDGDSDAEEHYWIAAGDQVIDFKTTTRKKLTLIKEAFLTPPDPDGLDTTALTDARQKVHTYRGQIMLYARGIGNVSTCTFVFLCRDGTGDNDIWAHDVPYDAEYAEKVWTRLEKIWAAVQDGKELSTFKQHPWCYRCQRRD
jgi:hypothetical protein